MKAPKLFKLLALLMVFAVSCTKPDEQNNGGNNNSNNGGNNLNDHEYVDLGLPSGTLWATCNLGAQTPEEYGDYFAWGETQPKNIYSWNTYKYCNGDNGWNTLTKYCTESGNGYNGFTDNLTILLPEDDAATVNWGSEWCMPTQSQWEELYQYTTNTITTQNDVRGLFLTGSNGNSLFLPAAGRLYEGENNHDYNSNGWYWSNSLLIGLPHCAWRLNFVSDIYNLGGLPRSYGHSIRAVRSTDNKRCKTIDK